MTDGGDKNSCAFPAGAVPGRTFRRALSTCLLLSLFLTLPLSARAQETSGTFAGGSMRVGYDSRACNASLDGAVRYNSSPYNAVTFDVGTDHLSATAATLGVSDANQVTGSFWFRLNATGVDMNFQHHTSASRFAVSYEGSCNCITIGGKNAGATSILFVVGPTVADSNWHHLLYSFDLTQPSATHAHFYLDGVNAAPTINTFTSGPLDLDNSGVAVGGFITGGSYNGDLAAFWFDTSYIDFANESNRRKFISADGLPVYLGADGSLPTGSAPVIFLDGALAGWHANKGAGGGFTLNGTLAKAASQPGNGRGSIEYCDGAAWRLWGD